MSLSPDSDFFFLVTQVPYLCFKEDYLRKHIASHQDFSVSEILVDFSN